LAAFVAGLASRAPALPAADLDATPSLPAKSTQACVDAGVLLGWAGLVERLVVGAQAGFGGEAKIVLTGGNAARLMRLSDLVADAAHVPELIHDGLVALAGVAPAS
jgi:pantothenate kinase type III